MYVYMYIVHNLHFVYQENITEVLYCCNQTWTSVIPPWKSQTLISPKKRYKLFEIINLNFFFWHTEILLTLELVQIRDTLRPQPTTPTNKLRPLAKGRDMVNNN